MSRKLFGRSSASLKDQKIPLLGDEDGKPEAPSHEGGGGGSSGGEYAHLEDVSITTAPAAKSIPLKETKGDEKKLLKTIFEHLAEKTDKGDAAAITIISKNRDLLKCAILTPHGTQKETHDSPLHRAAREGRTAVVNKILEMDASLVHLVNKHDSTPLLAAAFAGHTEVCRILLEKGADVNAATEEGYTPFT